HPQSDVVACRLALDVVLIANLTRRRVARLRVAIDHHQPELLDLLRLAVLEEFEILLREVGDRLLLLVADADVDADEVDAAAECGPLPLLFLGCPRLSCAALTGAALPAAVRTRAVLT